MYSLTYLKISIQQIVIQQYPYFDGPQCSTTSFLFGFTTISIRASLVCLLQTKRAYSIISLVPLMTMYTSTDEMATVLVIHSNSQTSPLYLWIHILLFKILRNDLLQNCCFSRLLSSSQFFLLLFFTNFQMFRQYFVYVTSCLFEMISRFFFD